LADPKEEHNMAAQPPEIVVATEAELEDWIADRPQDLGKQEDPIRRAASFQVHRCSSNVS
jgi:hypothetical protein